MITSGPSDHELNFKKLIIEWPIYQFTKPANKEKNKYTLMLIYFIPNYDKLDILSQKGKYPTQMSVTKETSLVNIVLETLAFQLYLLKFECNTYSNVSNGLNTGCVISDFTDTKTGSF